MPRVPPSACEVYVSRPIPAGPLAELESRFRVAVGPETSDRAALLEGCRSARAVVAMLTDRIDAELLEACPKLRVVSNFAVGVNNVDLEACRARGLWVTNTPDVLTDATADLAMALLLACARRLPQGERELREGRWTGWRPLHGIGLLYRKLGIVGFGRIGQAVAKRALAFGMEVRHHSPRSPGSVPLEALLGWADVVSLHCPLTSETRHLLDGARLARMKRGAILVNTSRGPVVDEVALADALGSGQLGAAGLDVYEDEPRVHPRLLAAPNAILLPHLGSATPDAREGMGRLAVEAVIDVLEGRAPSHAVVAPPGQ